MQPLARDHPDSRRWPSIRTLPMETDSAVHSCAIDHGEGRLQSGFGRALGHLVHGTVIEILRVPLHPLELDPAACVLDRPDESLPQVRVEHWSARSGRPPLLWPREDACFTFSATYSESACQRRFWRPMSPTQQRGLPQGPRCRLAVPSGCWSRLRSQRAWSPVISSWPREFDHEEADPNAPTSRRRKGGAIGVDVQRVLRKHPAHAGLPACLPQLTSVRSPDQGRVSVHRRFGSRAPPVLGRPVGTQAGTGHSGRSRWCD